MFADHMKRKEQTRMDKDNDKKKEISDKKYLCCNIRFARRTTMSMFKFILNILQQKAK